MNKLLSPLSPFRHWAATASCVFLAAVLARADWDPGDPFKWVQLPDLTPQGMDVKDFKYGDLRTSSRTLADDWLCTVAGPITNIHIWCSWYKDLWPPEFPPSVSFVLAIHSDIPASPPDQPFSMPGPVLWAQTNAPGTYVVRPYAMMSVGPEGWFEPGASPFYDPYGDIYCWQYNFPILDSPFVQRGTPTAPAVYWLEVQAIYPAYSDYKFGWKTSDMHWNDSAVYATQFAPYADTSWGQLLYPVGHPLVDQRIDLAFVVETGPLRPIHKHFFRHNLLPPLNGLYVQPETQTVAFANGLLLRNPAHRLFTAGITPPGPGGDVTHAFGSQVEMEVSMDGGVNWEPHVANGATQVYMADSGSSGDDTLYTTEMLALDISGGTLPGAVLVRESPTKASSGETRIETIPGGYMIDSFFDIWCEVSMDGGTSWVEALQPVSMELKVDPESVPAVAAPRPAEPMPNGQYVSTQPLWQGYANGVMLRGVRDKQFTQWMDPPLPGGSQTHTFDSQLDLQLSLDGGLHWQMVRVPGVMTFNTKNVREFSGQTTEEEIVTQLDISGGELPAGVLIRESPTKASEGGTARTAGGGGAGGGYMISSFFDIFTEVSTDGGSSWSAATNGPAHMELERSAPACEFTSNLLPPPQGEYAGTQPQFAFFANNVVISSFAYRSFTASIPPPPPGSEVTHTYGTTVELEIFMPGGGGWSHVSAPATSTIRITGLLGGTGGTEFYDTEMLQLDCDSGSPANVRIRESPTRASLGRTTITDTGLGVYNCDSFFDIFIEVSLDGGQTWSPTLAGPGTVTLNPLGQTFDFGDAPDPTYPTLLVSNGARHVIVSQGPFLGLAGDQPDPEANGQPNPTATGDDVAGTSPDDEDGVIIPSLPIGVNTAITVIVGQPGWVDGWIDWNGDGVWQDPAERVVGANLPVGANPVWVIAPGPYFSRTFARFRIHSGAAALPPAGLASDGEVEDYEVWIEPEPAPPDPLAKWWSPPDLTTSGIDVDATTPLLQADDFLCREHTAITNIVVWGSWKNDAFPGDPKNATFYLSIHSDIPAGGAGGPYSMPGRTLWLMTFPPGFYSAEIERAGLHEGWYNPYNQEYIPWTVPGDTVCYRYTFPVPLGKEFVQTGTVDNPIVYWLDVQAIPNGPDLAQFGWKTSTTHWNDDAAWAFGEEPYNGIWSELRYPAPHPLEGHSLDLAFGLYGTPVEPQATDDFGDAPDPTYPTLLASNGARHKNSPLFLGAQIDAEPDGQPSPGANGDDLANLADEDGIALAGMPWIPGGSGTVGCTSSGAGFLDAWADFNQDGDWQDAGEQICVGVPVSAGFNFPIFFNVPGYAVAGLTYARFRLSGTGGLLEAGAAPDGEVEDYLVDIGEPLLDFGDAPDGPNVAGYPTLLAHNGARHYLRGTLYMGAQVDNESDGQPTNIADGDDTNGADDEDGVVFVTPFDRGETAKMQVTVSAAGTLDAWIDLNADSDWNDPGEQMAASLPVSLGVNVVSFVVPGTATKGVTFTRFRLSTNGGVSPAGLADDGEVEDYAVTIEDRFPPTVGPKWIQPPDLAYGIDIPSWLYVQKGYEPYLVADDWWCDGRPIDAIRWWGSYLDYGGESNAPAIPIGGIRPSGFRLHWYTDIPATNSPTGYSTPGAELLYRDVPLLSFFQPLDSAGVVKEFYSGTVDLGFLGPNYAGIKEHKFRYDFYLEDSWNEKAGRIYWLGIEALYDEGEPTIYPWGWSTTPILHNWNDDAVVQTNTATGERVWGEMTYLPKVQPYATLDQHPYLGWSVNMAYQLLSRVTPRRAYVWRAPPDMTYGTDMDSWRYEPPQPGYIYPLRADDWMAEGRRVSNVHWWGSYLDWMHDRSGSELAPVPPPIELASPLGFKLSWHEHGLAQPGAALTNLFVPLEYCHQTYFCCVTQYWQGVGVYEHEYQYYVDLLDPRVSGVPWNVVSNTLYWLDIQALFGPGFIPGQYGHAGWGWKTTPEIQGNPSVVATNSTPFWWEPGTYPAKHPFAGLQTDLAFELTTDQVGTNRWHAAPNIVAIVIPTNTTSTVLVASVGDVLAGEQQLRMETNLTNATFSATVDYRPVPFPPPWTNWFRTTAATNLWEFYRIYQVAP